jgi:formylglycine-generating enzyme required for sulfatase activity
MTTVYNHLYLRQLRRLIDQHFDVEELRTLCFDLGLRYDSLGGNDKTAKVRELVDLLMRRGRLEELVEVCREERPKVEWGEKNVQHGGTGDTEKEEWGTQEKTQIPNPKSQVQGTQGKLGESEGTQEKGVRRGENVAETGEPELVEAPPKPAGSLLSGMTKSYFLAEWRQKHVYGEPEWVEIPAGVFFMGSQRMNWATPLHLLNLERFWIGRFPVTNAQYRLFVEGAGYKRPSHWKGGDIPAGLEKHPVVWVNGEDAWAYCRWLSEVTGKRIMLPSEAEWEKAARGEQGMPEYPWGDGFEMGKANTKEAGLGTTSAVDSYPGGVSPYGVWDMCGNVWEWTRSLWGAAFEQPDFGYPYKANDGREDLAAEGLRVLRGGAWYTNQTWTGCSARHGADPNGDRTNAHGFRVVMLP